MRQKPLRWRKQPLETGLARVCAAPRGFQLRLGTEVIARVYPANRMLDTWYWVAASPKYGVPLKSTWSEPVATLEMAKAEAKAYVLEHLQR